MIVCQRCGFTNEDQSSFCDSCGSFLEWAGVVPVQPSEADEPGTGATQHVPVVGAEEAGPLLSTRDEETGTAPTPHGAAVDATATRTAPDIPEVPSREVPNGTVEPTTASIPAVETELQRERGDEADPSRGTAGPIAPEARLPGARQPAPSRARGTPRRAAAVQPLVLPGQEACPSCGIGNDRTRTFCRRCGVLLHPDVTPPERLHWWQRLLRWLRAHRRRELKAGERPGQHRRFLPQSAPGWLSGTIAKVMTVVIVVFAVLATIGPVHRPIDRKLRQWKDDILLAVHPTYDPVHPISATATSSLSGHPPQLVIDGLSNTFWATGPTDNGIGTTLTIRFASPTTINRVGFLIGDQSTPAAYLSEPRPELVHLAFSARPNVGTTLLLADTAKFQTFSVEAKDATEMTLTIDSVYPSATGHDCAITQVEFFTKRP